MSPYPLSLPEGSVAIPCPHKKAKTLGLVSSHHILHTALLPLSHRLLAPHTL